MDLVSATCINDDRASFFHSFFPTFANRGGEEKERKKYAEKGERVEALYSAGR